MIDNITFFNENLILPFSVGAVVVLFIFIWKEWHQSGIHRLAIKVFLAFLAVSSLVLIALKPANQGVLNSNKLVLLTAGFEDYRLDSLKKVHKNLKWLVYEPGKWIHNELRAVDKVFILGQGLKQYDLWQMDEVPVVYLAGKDFEGIVKLNYEKEYFVGDILVLKGLYLNQKNGNQIIVQDPAGTGIDSVLLNAENKQKFLLSADLKVAGNYLFSLVEKDSLGEIVTADPVPVIVSEKEPLDILILNTFPTFETRYLKNFLAETGNRITVRSQITTDRYKFEYFNTEDSPVGKVLWNNLESFDLLILDGASLQSLPNNQLSAIKKSVRVNGTGVFIQADESFFNPTTIGADIDFERFSSSEISIDQWPGIKFSIRPFTLKNDFGIQSIHIDRNLIWTGYKRYGAGRIGTSVFTNTFQLQLDGHSKAYKVLWSQVVEKISRKENTAPQWELNPMFVYKDEPLEFELRTLLDSVVVKNQDGMTIALIQDIDFPTNWKGTTWPKKYGWNSLKVDSSGTHYYYVPEEKHWKALSAFNSQEANSRYFNPQKELGQRPLPLEDINPVWFFSVFLVCMGCLWLEPKLG